MKQQKYYIRAIIPPKLSARLETTVATPDNSIPIDKTSRLPQVSLNLAPKRIVNPAQNIARGAPTGVILSV